MRTKKALNIQMGERMKRARASAGLTQEQFAELIEKTPQYVSDLERGVYGVSLETLKTICERLSVSADDLLFGTQNDNQAEHMAQRLNRLPPEQFAALSEIINQFIFAMHLPGKP